MNKKKEGLFQESKTSGGEKAVQTVAELTGGITSRNVFSTASHIYSWLKMKDERCTRNMECEGETRQRKEKSPHRPHTENHRFKQMKMFENLNKKKPISWIDVVIKMIHKCILSSKQLVWFFFKEFKSMRKLNIDW